MTTSKDIPIIFSAPMIRALLNGSKTQTRRILTPQPKLFLVDGGRECEIALEQLPDEPRPRIRLGNVITTQEVRYAPGDRLWVRENFKPVHSGDPSRGALYQADVDRDQTVWKPSIHMPRWASRATLDVNGVKVERIQDISHEDALAEGVQTWRDSWTQKQSAEMFLRGTEAAVATREGTVAQRLFYLLWTLLHGVEGWTKNPFVVAPAFRVIKANIDAKEASAA